MLNEKGKSLECPSCHLIDSVQKVSSIVKSGTSETHMKGTGVGGAYSFGDDGLSLGGGKIWASGNQVTVLSKQLARPNLQPEGKSGLLTWLFFGSCAIAIILLLSAAFVAFFVFALIAVGLFFPFSRERGEYSEYVQHFQTKANLALQRWNHLYYCHRCDGIFVPGEELGSSERMLSYIDAPR